MLTVNTNVASLNAQRNLATTGKMLNQSLERLSSGLRINRASDDAAGLAISEGLRSQVRGLNQAIRNANDGISLLNTAESALDESTNMLQRIRELAVQSANDINSTTNRSSMQSEISNLLSEMTRIGNTVQFNGTTLLNGSFSSKLLQIGASANQTLSISIGDMRAASLGEVAISTSAAPTAQLSNGDVTLNGASIGATAADSVSTTGGAYSSIAMAAAVNSVSGTTSVSATVNATTKTGNVAVAGGGILGGGMVVNGVNVGAVTVLVNDSDSALRNAINAKSNQTGVVATLDSSNKLVLTASDGRNISFAGSTQAFAATVGYSTIADSTGTFTGTYTLTSDATFTIAGAAPLKAGLTAGSVAVDANQAVNNVDVTTSSGAASAITRVDNALRQVSAQRSSLGAYTNRLQSTVSNLSTVSENLSAADSRIRDADFATETAALTKAQILQQAGTAILAQANTLPQAVLSLLK